MDGKKGFVLGAMRTNSKINNKQILYRLKHKHYTDGYLQIIYIGLFSSKEKAENIVDELIIQPGFKLHSRSCFEITKIILNDFNWKKGFYKVENDDIEIK